MKIKSWIKFLQKLESETMKTWQRKNKKTLDFFGGII